jgi:hypothetical protein
MSDYPSTLSTRIQEITNYRQNTVKIFPSNSIAALTVTSGADVTIVLPPNSLQDLSSLTVNGILTTAAGAQSANGIVSQPFYLCKDTNNLIDRLTITIGGTTVMDTQHYNSIQNFIADYTYSYESKSKRLLQNMDAFTKLNDNGTPNGQGCVVNANSPLLAIDSRPITLANFIGFLGGDPKFIDTTLTGEVRIIFHLAAAANVLYLANGYNQAALGGNGLGAVPTPSYTLTNIYATILKAEIDDGIFFPSITTALKSGMPFVYKFKNYYDMIGNTTADMNGAIRYESSGHSVDMIYFTYYNNALRNGGIALLGGMTNNQQQATGTGFASLTPTIPATPAIPAIPGITIAGSATGAAIAAVAAVPGIAAVPAPTIGSDGTDTFYSLKGALSSFTSQYFNRTGQYITGLQWTINGNNIPQYSMTLQDIYQQLLRDFGHTNSTDNGIYPGINSFQSWYQNYFLATCRLDHLSQEKFISGYNTSGIPLTIQLQVQAAGAPGGGLYIPHVICESTRLMEVYSGRYINLVL